MASNTKDIILQKKIKLRVLSYEYEKISYPQYEKLNILQTVAFHERLISLLEEISYLFPEKVNISMSHVTHGGFVPIQSVNFFKNVSIHYTNDHEQTIPYNLKFHNTKIKRQMIEHDWIDVNFDQPGQNIVISPNPNLVFPSRKVHFYSLTNNSIPTYLPEPNLYVYVSDSIHDSFVKRFQLEIKENEKGKILTYDNLLHLCVMVKNGGKQFEEMLIENRDICDHWTILDTGSTDQTIENIHNVLVGKKRGEIYEEPFINFRDSRNRCLDLAGKSCKFIIMLDDTYRVRGNIREFLHIVRGDSFADSFTTFILSDDTKYGSNRIIKSESGLRYMYRIHEVISDKNNINVAVPENTISIFDARYDYMEERTMIRKQLDIKLLNEEVEEDPSNPRSYYYLAQTYSILKEYEKAYEYFMKRAEFTNSGFIQERIDSVFEAARLANFQLKKPWEECLALYEKCFKIDESRPDALYFIGVHYYIEGNYRMAFPYFKRGFEIGFPEHCQYSLKPTLSYHFLPKFLTKICYELEDYTLGEQAAEFFLKNNKQDADSFEEIVAWYSIFKKLNEVEKSEKIENPDVPKKPIFCFVADGGFNQWSGRNILTTGVGGSETYIIEMARHIQRDGRFDVVVFCNCPENEVFEGVQYRHLREYATFIHTTYVHTCIISRFTEYLPVTFKGHAENVYAVLHDLTPSGNVIPKDPKLKNIFCLTEWHVDYFTQRFPMLKDITVPFYYGIDTDRFKEKEKEKYRFIYSSFANRGLLPLLQMWPSIHNIQPMSTLHIYADLDNHWVNQNFPDQMKEIKRIKEVYKKEGYGIHWHGWVDKKELSNAWLESDIWFYPCIFMETFCLTALEAALSKTLVVTNNLAALQNTVGDRGLMIPIQKVEDVLSPEWQKQALGAMTPYLTGNDDEGKKLVDKNYEWASTRSWENRAKDMLDNYVMKHKYQSKSKYTWVDNFPLGQKDVFVNQLEKFNNHLKHVKCECPRILEIGCETGLSTIGILERVPNSVIDVIDKWKRADIEDSFHHNISIAGVKDRVTTHKGETLHMLLKLTKKDAQFDMIHVNSSSNLIIVAFELLKPGGMFIFKPSSLEILNQFFDTYHNQYDILEKGYYLCIVKK